MIDAMLLSSFDLLWELENKPLLDILLATSSDSNNPNAPLNLKDKTPYTEVLTNVPCVFAGGPAFGQVEDDTTRTDLSLFIKKTSLGDTLLSHKMVFKFEKRLYKLKEKDPNIIFNLVEFNLIRAD